MRMRGVAPYELVAIVKILQRQPTLAHGVAYTFNLQTTPCAIHRVFSHTRTRAWSS